MRSFGLSWYEIVVQSCSIFCICGAFHVFNVYIILLHRKCTVSNKKNIAPVFQPFFFPYIYGTAWATKDIFTSSVDTKIKVPPIGVNCFSKMHCSWINRQNIFWLLYKLEKVQNKWKILWSMKMVLRGHFYNKNLMSEG